MSEFLIPFENHRYELRQPEHAAMELANGIVIDRTEHSVFSRGALVWTDKENRSIVEWVCPHMHTSDEAAHECAREKWFDHHG